ncbi:glycosyl transferase group 1 [Thiorhodococcus drewsii AZ1]|uniref:Glycosyl transferase group 1 n=1 Tax=Thiorhodococcus drewsii AZ1 TaxID=765913 RepID=G2DVH6_9GAMM|nr:glycosyltransferase [Thiorhodococcus drewsii]EGV33991.1 glycosyl transferase group 1 [Thiorhodococcus drewsii AZ1]
MRVLHIGKYFAPFAGGMEYFLGDLLPALHAQGVAVAALVHADGRSTPGPKPTLGDPIPVYRAPCLGRLLYAPISPAFPIWLNRLIRDFRPDLLHLHLPNTSAFAALALPSARRIPWVVHWHSDVVTSDIDRRLALAYRLYRPFEQALLARAQAVIATSPDYLESSTALRPWRDRCHVIPLGLNAERIPNPDHDTLGQAERLWAEPGTRILAVGRLTYYKGHEVLIDAAARLPDSRILIVGTGDLQDRLTAKIAALGLEQRITLTGFQPDAVLQALVASCDLLCLPSLERTEAFGLVQLEAMRFGKPVVVSDIAGSGTGWVVREAENGLLTSPGDPAQLAERIGRLQSNARLREDLGARGRLALAERFGIEAISSATADLYRRILFGE